MRAVITGATGFIGRHLAEKIRQPVGLSRNVHQDFASPGGAEMYLWEPRTGPPPGKAFQGAEAVFHLAGERVGKGRWTAAKKEKILNSRIQGTRNLVEGLRPLAARPRVLVCASAVGYYGSRGDEPLDEQAPSGEGFLAEVCKGWEDEANRAADIGVRVVSVRIGLVLGRDGGAMQRILPLFRKGLGGRLGNGRQWWPWIHIDDVVGIMLHAAENDGLQGPLNAVSPNPVTNREFARALASALHRPAVFPAPVFALRIALGEFASVLLASQRVTPEKAKKSGYVFKHTELDRALQDIVC